MKYLIIEEKTMGLKQAEQAVKEATNAKFKINRRRGKISIFFPDKHLTRQQCDQIARQLGMRVTGNLNVRGVLNY